MRPIRSVSVLMPTWRGMEFLPRVLDALANQECELKWDLRVVDSSSDDGTWEYLQERATGFPVSMELERIDSVEFDHGDTRNLLAARSNGDLLVFLTQDAIPSDKHWLRKLANNFASEAVGAAYCRNLPRPDAELLTTVFSDTDPGYVAGRREERIANRAAYESLDPHARRLLYNFNDVASALRRELWQRHPFPRTNFGEDILMARAMLEAGFTVVYDDEATVEHSHDYGPQEMRSRARIDAQFNAEYLDRVCVGSLKDAQTLVQRQLVTDREALIQAGVGGPELDKALVRAKDLRVAAFEGLYEGGTSQVRRPASKMLAEEAKPLHILYVVHGFPPDTWAGTEIYTYNIAKEMERRGYRCTILHRVPAQSAVADGGAADFTIEEADFQGLRVLRWTHRLQHESLRHSYQHPKAEETFARLLRNESPDLVHFQHLIHSSAGLVHVAKAAGLATMVHCHDYWALCARVQLIRPDGERCEGNQGLGCYACVKEKSLPLVNTLARHSAMAGPLLAKLERELQPGPGPAGAIAGKLEGLSDLMDRHEYVTAAYAAADLRVSPSRFLRSKYLESGRFDPHTFLFSDNGMRTDHVHALAKPQAPDGRVRFGFVGSLVWYKGGEAMVRAMSHLDPKDAVLNVYGTFDPEGDEHHAELQALAQGSAVEFKGRFDNARLSEVYAEIDVLIVPSIWFENSPITIHEAYLTQTPVLASDIGGMAEFVIDGVDGLHFKVGDEHDLAHKMQRFVDEPGLVDQLSQDFMPIKTIIENGEEMDFRYRGLVCLQRAGVPHAGNERLFTAAAQEGLRLGATDNQGADMVLVRPGPENALEFDIRGCGGGTRRIAVTSFSLGAEPNLVLGGRLLVDGQEHARLADFGGSDDDQARREDWVLELPMDAARLRLEPGPERFLRVCSVEVTRAEGEFA
ncbi:MAG: glycosyltransferase involved in cell wall biosynthesis/GT2 family glycosyltransferase [Candidatus Paceibacteria bacterium]|jgi:glycosyltransferase involved in cell wall biosynthesis/GT2 family glycosyltransferase